MMKLLQLASLCLVSVLAHDKERVRSLQELGQNIRKSEGARGISRRLFLSTLACRIDLQMFRSCFCREEAFVRAIARAGSNPNLPTRINICAGTIDLSAPLDITGKAIVLGCENAFFVTCELSGQFSHRIFEGSPELLMIDGVILKNGNANNVDTEHSINAGGALFLSGGSAIISNSAFDGNQAGGGGAIYVGPGATLVTEPDVNFFFNRATQEDGKFDKDGNLLASGGGAILSFGGQLTLEGGWFSGNSASGLGGAIYGDTSSITVTDVFFDNNVADSGGAIAANATVYQLFTSSFLDNMADEGNDVYVADDEDANSEAGSFVFCDQAKTVSFCDDFLTGAIAEIEGGLNFNTNCLDEGLDDFDGNCDAVRIVEGIKS